MSAPFLLEQSEVKHTPGPWTISSVGSHFVVTRWYPQGGHETMKAPGARRISKFRSEEAATRAIYQRAILDAYEQALRVAPEQPENHLAYYADKWARCFGVSESIARAAIRKATLGSEA